jgi:hypothetical protein
MKTNVSNPVEDIEPAVASPRPLWLALDPHAEVAPEPQTANRSVLAPPVAAPPPVTTEMPRVRDEFSNRKSESVLLFVPRRTRSSTDRSAVSLNASGDDGIAL